MNKYHAKKTRAADGSLCDSAKEANRYNELLVLQRLGAISDLRRQVKYELIPAQGRDKPCCYIADFVYRRDGQTVVEDAKGVRTKEYIIKRKLMKWRHGITISEV